MLEATHRYEEALYRKGNSANSEGVHNDGWNRSQQKIKIHSRCGLAVGFNQRLKHHSSVLPSICCTCGSGNGATNNNAAPPLSHVG